MRDSRRARLVLAMLLLTAFTLITLDYRSGGGGPLRSLGNAVFGPVERAVSAVVDPVGSFFGSLGHLNSYKDENARLRKQNQHLLTQLRTTDGDRAHLLAAEKLLHLAGRGHFRIVAARVVGIGSDLGFEWTATIDIGSRDGIRRNETVINGDGLVGRTVDVGPTTSTVLLASDPTFTAGARLETSQQVGLVEGGGHSPMTFKLLNPQAQIKPGERLVTFGSKGDVPFVPEIPIGHITRVEPTPGELFRRGVVAPYVNYTAIDVVGVIVGMPRTVPRNSLLPPSPTPSPAASPSSTPAPGATSSPGSASPSPGTSPAAGTSPATGRQPAGRRSPSPTGSP
ncbi:MAG TPA: rod shape-determining protein MreC [Mycobacteriales bacterium]|nr:rod shape-determining protein MreC [Mycobacteriales bacterium]